MKQTALLGLLVAALLTMGCPVKKKDGAAKADDKTGEKTAATKPAENGGDTATAAAAGGDADPAACKEAAAKIHKVMLPKIKEQMAQLPPEQKSQAEAQLTAEFTPEKLAEGCVREKPPAEVLDCIKTAEETPEAIEACMMKAAPGGAMPGGGMPAPPPGADPHAGHDHAPGEGHDHEH